MKNKLKAVARILVPLLFWITVWQVMSIIIGHSYFLPSVPKTFDALWSVICSKNFLKVVSLTLIRVITGLTMGIILGLILAYFSHMSGVVRALITPLVSIIKSTPVATFIIILWVMMDGNSLAIFIAILMVMPIIWQNMMDGYDSINRELSEVCDVFEFSFFKRMRILVLPALIRFLVPAVITSSGLAWKSEIAAEIIAYTKQSIGQHINDAKYNFDTATVFAWTLIIILMSILIEKITKYFLGRYKR